MGLAAVEFRLIPQGLYMQGQLTWRARRPAPTRLVWGPTWFAEVHAIAAMRRHPSAQADGDMIARQFIGWDHSPCVRSHFVRRGARHRRNAAMPVRAGGRGHGSPPIHWLGEFCASHTARNCWLTSKPRPPTVRRCYANTPLRHRRLKQRPQVGDQQQLDPAVLGAVLWGVVGHHRQVGAKAGG